MFIFIISLSKNNILFSFYFSHSSGSHKPPKKKRCKNGVQNLKKKLSLYWGTYNTTNLLANSLTHAQMIKLFSQTLQLEKKGSVAIERGIGVRGCNWGYLKR